MVTFLRRTSNRYSRLGKKRKKKQVWRRPTGRDNKMREKRRGYPAVVSVGYKRSKKIKGKIKDKTPKIVKNLKELEELKKDEIAVIGKIGTKKKVEIVKKAKEKGIEIYNVNIKKFLKKHQKIKGKENESK